MTRSQSIAACSSVKRGSRIAVIGAGISGLTAAKILQRYGHSVTVFEKSRGPGGRAATRRENDLHFDHGAQYFTAHHTRFRQSLAAWQECGLVEKWSPRLGLVGNEQSQPSTQEVLSGYVAVPGMNALAKHLAQDLEVMTQTIVAAPEHQRDRWQLSNQTGASLGDFDQVIISAPAPQAHSLLATAAPALSVTALQAEYAPAWSVMLGFDKPPDIKHNALRFSGGPLDWAADNSSKPQRDANTWVLHASADWSREHLDDPPQAVAAYLSEWFCNSLKLDRSKLQHQDAHRWLYALVIKPLKVGALWDTRLGIGACGDWCQGCRIEDAFLSGEAIARLVLGQQ